MKHGRSVWLFNIYMHMNQYSRPLSTARHLLTLSIRAACQGAKRDKAQIAGPQCVASSSRRWGQVGSVWSTLWLASTQSQSSIFKHLQTGHILLSEWNLLRLDISEAAINWLMDATKNWWCARSPSQIGQLLPVEEIESERFCYSRWRLSSGLFCPSQKVIQYSQFLTCERVPLMLCTKRLCTIQCITVVRRPWDERHAQSCMKVWWRKIISRLRIATCVRLTIGNRALHMIYEQVIISCYSALFKQQTLTKIGVLSLEAKVFKNNLWRHFKSTRRHSRVLTTSQMLRRFNACLCLCATFCAKPSRQSEPGWSVWDLAGFLVFT